MQTQGLFVMRTVMVIYFCGASISDIYQYAIYLCCSLVLSVLSVEKSHQMNPLLQLGIIIVSVIAHLIKFRDSSSEATYHSLQSWLAEVSQVCCLVTSRFCLSLYSLSFTSDFSKTTNLFDINLISEIIQYL